MTDKPMIQQGTVTQQERNVSDENVGGVAPSLEVEAAVAAGVVDRDGPDEVQTSHITSAMRSMEEAWGHLRDAAKHLHLAEVGSPIHQNVLLLVDAIREEESRLSRYTGGDEG